MNDSFNKHCYISICNTLYVLIVIIKVATQGRNAKKKIIFGQIFIVENNN